MIWKFDEQIIFLLLLIETEFSMRTFKMLFIDNVNARRKCNYIGLSKLQSNRIKIFFSFFFVNLFHFPGKLDFQTSREKVLEESFVFSIEIQRKILERKISKNCDISPRNIFRFEDQLINEKSKQTHSNEVFLKWECTSMNSPSKPIIIKEKFSFSSSDQKKRNIWSQKAFIASDTYHSQRLHQRN